MLSWLRNHPSDHPLDDKDEAQRFLAKLEGKSHFIVLDELAQQLDAIKTTDNLRPTRAYEITDLLDRVAKPHMKTLTGKYVDESERLTRFQQHRIWFTATSFLSQLNEAYRHCLSQFEVGASGSTAIKPYLAKICGRAIRCGTAHIKWSLLHYSEVDAGLWEHLARLYAQSEKLAFAFKPMTLYRGERLETSVSQEFLRSLMLGVSAPEKLLPIQVEIADRVIARCAGAFELSSGGKTKSPRSIDLGAPVAPHRRSPNRDGNGEVRNFGPGEALLLVSKWKAQLERSGTIDPDLNLGLHVRVPVLLATFEHLILHWSLNPQRKQVRRPNAEKASVCYGFPDVVSNVGALFLESPFVSNDEEWLLDDESDTGLGLRVTPALGDWLRVGRLIGVRREERAAWDAGIVRRVTGDEGGHRRVGVELLGSGGTSVTVFSCDPQARKDHENGDLCVLLPNPSRRADHVHILLPPGLFKADETFELHAYGRRYLLRKGILLERGEDFDLARFQLGALEE